MNIRDRIWKFINPSDYYHARLKALEERVISYTRSDTWHLKERKSYSFIKVARNLSVEMEKDFIKCPYCGTLYTQKQMDNMENLNCIECGGAMK